MDERAAILQKLDEARRLELGRCYFAVPSAGPKPERADHVPLARLVVLLSGAKTVRLHLQQGARDVHLEGGDLLYCLPETWEVHEWRGRYDMLCIVPRRDYLRVSCYQRDDFHDASRPLPIFHHTGLPYHQTLRSTINALNAAVNLPDERIVHALSKALLGLAELECRRCPAEVGGRPEQLFNRICNWLTHSFQEAVTRELVAKVFGVSPVYVSRLFQSFGDRSFHEYLTQCRMNHACELLEQTDQTVYQVADHSGFGNYVNFVRRFRQLNGMPPGKYRQAAWRKASGR